jgi:hypothetical protein
MPKPSPPRSRLAGSPPNNRGGYNAAMNNPKTLSILATLALAAGAGWLTGGLHGACVYLLLAGAAICWKTA